ncbi:hypothetical protein KQH40_00980 [bacterium]|nr:hypothetical protein [bacterium]
MAEKSNRTAHRIEAIGHYLFNNPWSTASEISALTGIKKWVVWDIIKNHPRYFENVSIPRGEEAPGTQYFSSVYALTSWGSKKSVGFFRSPKFLAQALLSSYSRLPVIRQELSALYQAGALDWSITPWQIKRRGLMIDALASLKAGNGLSILAAFIMPPQLANLLWYELLIKEWMDWRKKGGYIQPANLYVWQPRFETATVPEYLASKAKDRNGNLFIFSGKHVFSGRISWSRLTDNEIVPVNSLFIQQAAFVGQGIRKSHYNQATSLTTWAQGNADDDEYAVDTLSFLNLSRGEIDLLKVISLYPPATILRARELIGAKRGRRDLKNHVQNLEQNGLVRTLQDDQKTILVTHQGLSLLGGLAGMNGRLYASLLGWPNRPAMYAAQVEHFSRIISFLMWLNHFSRLKNWSTLRCKYSFKDISLGTIKRKVITIHPDGEGDYQFSTGEQVKFWLEVDRGTRKGRRFTSQLERYFLIRYARILPVTTPTLLYVVDTGNGQDEGRMRSAVRRLKYLARTRYPNSGLIVLFTTGELIDQADQKDPGKAKIWRVYALGQFNKQLISLEIGMRVSEEIEKMRSSQTTNVHGFQKAEF